MSDVPEKMVIREAYDIVRAEENYIETNKTAGGVALAGTGLVVVGLAEAMIENVEHVGMLTMGLGMLTIMSAGALAIYNICRRHNIPL